MSIEARFRLDLPGFMLDVDLLLPETGVTALFGPSGSGKTTLLRAIAGLERVAAGRLVVGGEVWQDGATFLPVHARPLGYVFQEASLFPHLSVRANIDYGRKRSRTAITAAALDRIVELLGIGALLARKPEQLSGGERQRVALARALAVGPRLLLMDEPLAALDLARKQEILPYLERLRAELKLPILYVSHAPDEVARLADHLVVLEAGRVQAQGPLVQVLADVATPIRLGEDDGVVLTGVIAERDARWHLARVQCAGADFWVRDGDHAIGKLVRMRILARDVSIAHSHTSDSSILNILSAEVIEVGMEPHPALAMVKLRIGSSSLLARVTRRSVETLGLVPGTKVFAQIKAVALIA